MRAQVHIHMTGQQPLQHPIAAHHAEETALLLQGLPLVLYTLCTHLSSCIVFCICKVTSLLEARLDVFLIYGRSMQGVFETTLAADCMHGCLQVEQARFLVPPFTLGQAALDMNEVQAQQEQLPGTPEQGGGGTRSILAHLRCPSPQPIASVL